MARTKNPSAATVKAWKTRRRNAGAMGASATVQARAFGLKDPDSPVSVLDRTATMDATAPTVSVTWSSRLTARRYKSGPRGATRVRAKSPSVATRRNGMARTKDPSAAIRAEVERMERAEKKRGS